MGNKQLSIFVIDPTLHHVNATKAWEMMVECFGCTISDLKSFCLNGIDAAWVADDVKQKWKKEWGCYFDRSFALNLGAGSNFEPLRPVFP